MNIHFLRQYKNTILYRKKIQKCDMTPLSMDYEQCISILQKANPDQGASCISESKQTFPDNNIKGDKYLLDIIVPAYNVEKYIEECLNSLLKQKTHYTYRIIVVNDGSTDHTSDILKKYEDIKNIKIITQKNKGLSGARNTALDYANARYIMFVDSDDRIPEDAVEKMLAAAIHSKTDIVAGSYCNYWKHRNLRGIHRQAKGILESTMTMKGHAWGKIYRRMLFDHIRFPEGYWFEDSLMHQIIFPLAHSGYGINSLIYERRNNPSSITHTAIGNPKSIDSVWISMRLMEDRQTLGLKTDCNYYEYMLSEALLTQLRLSDLNEEIQKASFVIFRKIIKDTFHDYRTKNPLLREAEYLLRKGYFEAFALFGKYRY